jgi:hypothetical protein
MEIGSFLRAIRELKEIKLYHQTTEKKTSINFKPYALKGSDDYVGFGLSIIQGDAKYSIPFTFEESYVLEEYLKFVLNHIFSATYAEDKKREAEYFDKKNGTQGKSQAKSSNKNPKVAEDDFEEDEEKIEVDEEDLF